MHSLFPRHRVFLHDLVRIRVPDPEQVAEIRVFSLVTPVWFSPEGATGCCVGWYAVRQYPNPLPVIGPRPMGPVPSNLGIVLLLVRCIAPLLLI